MILDAHLSQSLKFLYSAGYKLLETIHQIPTWLSSLQNKVNRVALEQFAKEAWTFTKNAIGFTIRVVLSFVAWAIHPGPFIVGLIGGICSDTVRQGVQRVNNTFHAHVIHGPLTIKSMLIRTAIVCTIAVFGILSIPFSDLALSIYIGALIGVSLSSKGVARNLSPDLEESLPISLRSSFRNPDSGLISPRTPLNASHGGYREEESNG